MIRVNGQPLSLVQPEILRFKVHSPTRRVLRSAMDGVIDRIIQ